MTSANPVTGPDDNYGFVRFSPLDKLNMSRQPLENFQHHRFHEGKFSGVLSYSLTNETMLFIGTNFGQDNQEIDPEKDVKPFIKDASDKPVIPGSTLKGHLRNLFEISTHSCVFMVREDYQVKDGPKSHLTEYPPFTNQKTPRKSQCKADQLCPTCRLFGTLKPAFRGRINISDAVLHGEPQFESKQTRLPVLMNPRPKSRKGSEKYNDYFADGQVSGRKVYRPRRYARGKDPNSQAPDHYRKPAQALKPNHTFHFTLHYRNLDPSELAALIRLLDLEPNAWHLLGAAKAHGWGRCKFTRQDWREYDMRRRYEDPHYSETHFPTGSPQTAQELKERFDQLQQKEGYWHDDSYQALIKLLHLST